MQDLGLRMYVSVLCACVYQKNTISNNFRTTSLTRSLSSDSLVFPLHTMAYKTVAPFCRPQLTAAPRALTGTAVHPPVHSDPQPLHTEHTPCPAERDPCHAYARLRSARPPQTDPPLQTVTISMQGCFQKLNNNNNNNNTHHYARQNLSYAIHRCKTSFIIPTLSTP